MNFFPSAPLLYYFQISFSIICSLFLISLLTLISQSLLKSFSIFKVSIMFHFSGHFNSFLNQIRTQFQNMMVNNFKVILSIKNIKTKQQILLMLRNINNTHAHSVPVKNSKTFKLPKLQTHSIMVFLNKPKQIKNGSLNHKENRTTDLGRTARQMKKSDWENQYIDTHLQSHQEKQLRITNDKTENDVQEQVTPFTEDKVELQINNVLEPKNTNTTHKRAHSHKRSSSENTHCIGGGFALRHNQNIQNKSKKYDFGYNQFSFGCVGQPTTILTNRPNNEGKKQEEDQFLMRRNGSAINRRQVRTRMLKYADLTSRQKLTPTLNNLCEFQESKQPKEQFNKTLKLDPIVVDRWRVHTQTQRLQEQSSENLMQLILQEESKKIRQYTQNSDEQQQRDGLHYKKKDVKKNMGVTLFKHNNNGRKFFR